MVPPRSSRSRRRAWHGAVLAGVVGLQVLVLLAGHTPAAPDQDVPTTTRARVAPPLAWPPPSAPPIAVPPIGVPASPAARPQDRSAAVEQLLRARAQAVLRRDRDAFLAVVDPRARALRARQAASFDGLAQVPLGTWEYVLDPQAEELPDADLDRRHGEGAWWAPGVVLRYALEGFDPRPVEVEQHLVFVRRDGRWLLTADEDTPSGRSTPRALWDLGPVVAVRQGGVLVLGRPGHERLLRDVAGLAAEGVPRVTAFWGDWRRRAVIVVPEDAEELRELLGTDGDVSRLAAVATAELRGGRSEYDPTGDRVMVNPEVFDGLGRLSRRVVLTHELTHVATRPASGPAVPAWFAEGLADVVGYAGTDLPRSVTAADLRREVRSGRVPLTLPTEADFAGGSPRLPVSYQAAEAAVRLLLERHGRAAVLRLYRDIGARRGVPPEQALADGLRTLGTTPAAFTAAWRADLQRQLG